MNKMEFLIRQLVDYDIAIGYRLENVFQAYKVNDLILRKWLMGK